VKKSSLNPYPLSGYAWLKNSIETCWKVKVFLGLVMYTPKLLRRKFKTGFRVAGIAQFCMIQDIWTIVEA